MSHAATAAPTTAYVSGVAHRLPPGCIHPRLPQARPLPAGSGSRKLPGRARTKVGERGDSSKLGRAAHRAPKCGSDVGSLVCLRARRLGQSLVLRPETPKATLQWAVDIAESAIRTLKRPLTRGGVIDQPIAVDERRGYIRSFAGVYLVLLVSSGPPGERSSRMDRGVIGRALAKIQSLTLALPPPEGPGSGSAEGFGVA